MLDHIGIRVTDVVRSKAFYLQALAPLGYSVLRDYGEHVGFGVAPKPDFWITGGEAARIHVCFRAKDRAAVRAFYEAAIAAGATDNGEPGLRTLYHPNYYGGFVLDPDGNNIEACTHEPEP